MTKLPEALRKKRDEIIKLKINNGRANTLINKSDYEYASQFKWYLSSHGYVQRTKDLNGKKNFFYLHRELCGKIGYEVDHINGIKTDNRRKNLRLANRQQNEINKPKPKRNGLRKWTSKFKGVYFNKDRKKWCAQITVQYKRYALGRFDNEKDAAKKYNEAATRHFGEYAYLNTL